MPKSEAAKQIIDQTAHALWGVATGAAPFLLGWGAGTSRPASIAGYVIGTLLAVASLVVWTWREKSQWDDPDHPGAHVWWDPYLDSGVFLAFVVIGAAVTGALTL